MPERPQPEARRHWVLAAAGIPRGYMVLAREPVVLGRGRECEVVLASESVSRRHARITWGKVDGGGLAGYTIVDLGSKNGTLVNGQPVGKPRRLDHEDIITVGTVPVRFLVVEGSREELAARFDPRAEETSRVTPSLDPRSPLLGSLSPSILFEVCQLIEVHKHSGVLKVRSTPLSGQVSFREGQIVDARFAQETGEKAARKVLGMKRGEYAFIATGTDETPPSGPLKLRALALCVDMARAQDELSQTQALPRGIGGPSERRRG